jgi:hypothetical protein
MIVAITTYPEHNQKIPWSCKLSTDFFVICYILKTKTIPLILDIFLVLENVEPMSSVGAGVLE